MIFAGIALALLSTGTEETIASFNGIRPFKSQPYYWQPTPTRPHYSNRYSTLDKIVNAYRYKKSPDRLLVTEEDQQSDYANTKNSQSLQGNDQIRNIRSDHFWSNPYFMLHP